jgi:hypothetical protein
MKLTLTLLALAASVIAAPVAVPEAKPEAEAAPQGTYATYGRLKLPRTQAYTPTLLTVHILLSKHWLIPNRHLRRTRTQPTSSSWRLRQLRDLSPTRRWLWILRHLQEQGIGQLRWKATRRKVMEWDGCSRTTMYLDGQLLASMKEARKRQEVKRDVSQALEQLINEDMNDVYHK